MGADDIYSRVPFRRLHSTAHAMLAPFPLLLLLILQLLTGQAAAGPVNPCAHKGMAELIRTSPVIVKALAARVFSDELEGQAEADTILITLTPETIYKGASLLKVANGGAGAGDALSPRSSGLMSGSPGHHARGSGSGGSSGSSWSGAESAFQYEGYVVIVGIRPLFTST